MDLYEAVDKLKSNGLMVTSSMSDVVVVHEETSIMPTEPNPILPCFKVQNKSMDKYLYFPSGRNWKIIITTFFNTNNLYL